jgi:hypothetical protein
MPSGKRYRVTLDKVVYDLSPEQFGLLSQKSFRLPKVVGWHIEQRVKGLLKLRLFAKQPRTYQRTSLGDKVYKANIEKNKTKQNYN